MARRLDGEAFPTGLHGGALRSYGGRDEDDFGFDDGAPAAGPLAPLVSASGSWGGAPGGGASLLRARDTGASVAEQSDFDFAP